MGISTSVAVAFGKAQLAAGVTLPDRGGAFISVQDEDKPLACHIAQRLRNLGFTIVATEGTAAAMQRARIPTTRVNKVQQGSPHVVDAMQQGAIALVMNTTQGAQAIRDSYAIRRHALLGNVPYFTTMAAALAAVDALETFAHSAHGAGQVRSVQEWHARSRQLNAETSRS
jgi:carbamoyl-phosphate synthase large subunit